MSEIESLFHQRRWEDLLASEEDTSETAKQDGFHWFACATAAGELGREDACRDFIRKGLAEDPNSTWGHTLDLESRLRRGEFDEAFARAREFILRGSAPEAFKTLAVQYGLEHGRLADAIELNRSRSVIADPGAAPRFALALQVFVKSDTLSRVLESLLKLEASEHFSLYVIQDSLAGSELYAHCAAEHQAVRETLARFHAALMAKFTCVTFLSNTRNLGTAPTCKRALDLVAESHEGFLFIEDDCVLSRKALLWAMACLERINPADSWFFGCESPFFDSHGRPVPPELLPRLERIARHPACAEAVMQLDFVPSTCFGTTSAIWKVCADARGCSRGPETLNALLKQLGRTTLVPVVPLAADIGMQNALGYSVANLGTVNVKEVKSVYLLNEDACPQLDRKLPRHDADQLYSATTNLDRQYIKNIENIFT